MVCRLYGPTFQRRDLDGGVVVALEAVFPLDSEAPASPWRLQAPGLLWPHEDEGGGEGASLLGCFHHVYHLPARGRVEQQVSAGGPGALVPRAVVAAGVVAVHHRPALVLRLQKSL